MSKGNLFLGQARGSVGDVTFTHIAGTQVARARNRSPRNPRVPSQMLQRIVLNSASKAYSLMQPIVNHSFEGVQGVARNQQRFMQLNTSAFRDKLAAVIVNPTEAEALASTAHSFSFKGDFYPQLNEYLISEGTLPRQVVACRSAEVPNFQLRLPWNTANVFSYADVIEAGGFEVGDQLTFIGLGHRYGDETYDQTQAFIFARVILEPAGGDLDINFIDSDSESIADPNPKNEGQVTLALAQDANGWYIEFTFNSMSNTSDGDLPAMVGGAVILSRFESGRWRRSAQSIVPAIFGGNLPALDTATFGAAYASYLLGDSSNLFLNGSPVGAPAAAPTAVYTITSVAVDADDLPKGGVNGDANGASLVVQGTNLNDANIRLVDLGRDTVIAPDTVTDTAYNWDTLNAVGTILQLNIGGEQWALLTGN